jgi:hypothetical protein
MKEEELKQIDDYFQMQLSESERIAFEQKIKTDPDFADLVAFYTHTKAIEREKILKARHADWTNEKGGKQTKFFPKAIIGIAATLLFLAGFWYFDKIDNKNYEEIATNYIQTELATLPMKMDAAEDSLELGKKLYNEKKYKEAFEIFEIIKKPSAQEFMGLCALQSKDYLRATAIFEQQAQNQELLNNKAKFYLGLTYLKMGETAKGEALMEEVVSENLAGKVEAEKILE